MAGKTIILWVVFSHLHLMVFSQVVEGAAVVGAVFAGLSLVEQTWHDNEPEKKKKTKLADVAFTILDCDEDNWRALTCGLWTDSQDMSVQVLPKDKRQHQAAWPKFTSALQDKFNLGFQSATLRQILTVVAEQGFQITPGKVGFEKSGSMAILSLTIEPVPGAKTRLFEVEDPGKDFRIYRNTKEQKMNGTSLVGALVGALAIVSAAFLAVRRHLNTDALEQEISSPAVENLALAE